MVAPAGLEPATTCLEGRHSVHLSYGAVGSHYTKTCGRGSRIQTDILTPREPIRDSGALPIELHPGKIGASGPDSKPARRLLSGVGE